MLVFSEYQTGTIDLALSFYGYEECTPNYSFGPAIRDTYVLHYITKGQGKFHYKGKIVDLKEGDFFLLKPEELQEQKKHLVSQVLDGTESRGSLTLAEIREILGISEAST